MLLGSRPQGWERGNYREHRQTGRKEGRRVRCIESQGRERVGETGLVKEGKLCRIKWAMSRLRVGVGLSSLSLPYQGPMIFHSARYPSHGWMGKQDKGHLPKGINTDDRVGHVEAQYGSINFSSLPPPVTSLLHITLPSPHIYPLKDKSLHVHIPLRICSPTDPFPYEEVWNVS